MEAVEDTEAEGGMEAMGGTEAVGGTEADGAALVGVAVVGAAADGAVVVGAAGTAVGDPAMVGVTIRTTLIIRTIRTAAGAVISRKGPRIA